MITNGGIDTTGLPPVIRFHLSAVQIVSAKPDAVPIRPPTRVKSRTGLRGRPWPVKASSKSSSGTGLYVAIDRMPRARSSRMARVAVSTCSKTPRTVEGPEVAISGRAHPAPGARWSP